MHRCVSILAEPNATQIPALSLSPTPKAVPFQELSSQTRSNSKGTVKENRSKLLLAAPLKRPTYSSPKLRMASLD